VGDTLGFKAADGGTAEFIIAGVVSSTGMDMARTYFDMNNSVNDMALTSVMGSVADGQKYFNAQGSKMILANLKPGVDPAMVEKVIRPRLTALGFESVSSVGMKQDITEMIQRVVGALSLIALSVLIIASFGVANMVIASTHARRFEFGVLRAIGAGRSQLVRMVLGEITIVALAAGILGSCAGLHYVFMASRIDRAMVGLVSPFVIVAGPILMSIGITLLLGWLAAIGPAIKSALSAQQTLLATGRD